MISSQAANIVPLDRRRPRHRRSAPIDPPRDVRWIGTAARERVFGDDRAAAVVSEGIERSNRVSSAAAVAGELAALTSFACRRLIGDYRVDDFGYDPEFAERVVLPMLRPLLNGWFRAEVVGLDNVPADGPALIVANHAGVLPLDALMAAVAIHDHHRAHGTLRIVAAVFSEGYKGLGKRFGDRYRLARFGRGGFAAAALRAGAPIVPCATVGAEEIYPMVANVGPLARLLGLPYFPITPTFPLPGLLGLVPLPSKWYIEFGTPITTSGCADVEDPMVVLGLADRVRQTVGGLLWQRLAVRRNVYAG